MAESVLANLGAGYFPLSGGSVICADGHFLTLNEAGRSASQGGRCWHSRIPERVEQWRYRTNAPWPDCASRRFLPASLLPAIAADVPIKLADLFATLNEVAPHARSYPPKFSTPVERATAEEHLKILLRQLDKISDRYPDDKEILFIKGAANAMGHNLDYPGCADKA